MPRTKPTADWTGMMFDASRLWTESGMVVALRSWRMMQGGAVATRELERMVSEKVEAGFELAGALASGRVKSPEAAAREALGVYGKRVRRNRRRLSCPKPSAPSGREIPPAPGGARPTATTASTASFHVT